MTFKKRLIQESYRWLLSKNKIKKAEQICKSIFNQNGILKNISANNLSQSNVQIYPNLNNESRKNNIVSWAKKLFLFHTSFKKNFLLLIFIWFSVTLAKFLLNENDREEFLMTQSQIDNYLIQSFIVGCSCVLLSLIFIR
jgi:hypothetical protein